MNCKQNIILKFLKVHIDKKVALLHLLFWITWIFSFVFIQSMGKEKSEYITWFMYYLITLPVFVMHTYLIAYWLVPKYFFTGRYLIFSLIILVFLFAFSIIELVISSELVFRFFDPSKVFTPGYLNFKNILISGIGNYYIIFVFLAIKAGKSWYNSELRREELLLSNVETELEIYKYQFQPRLILSLVEQMEKLAVRNPEKSPDLIIKVSGFLNRFLYEGREELIPLQLDVKLMEEYLDIYKVELEERIKLNFLASGNLKPFVVPPLLLLPFLFDSLKIVYECNNFFEISVFIKTEPKYLLFSFTIWSEDNFRLSDSDNVEITKQRLNHKFRGKHRLIENIDDNFREISLEIFL